jgi:hypothetical protein
MTHQFHNTEFRECVEALFDDSEMTPEEIRSEMQKLGYNPDALAARIKASVKRLSARSRLSWMDKADAAQTAFDRTRERIHSWTSRSREEIEKAFDEARQGRFGANAQTRLATAFSNVTEITTETKAAFLDDIVLLGEMDEQDEDETTKP